MPARRAVLPLRARSGSPAAVVALKGRLIVTGALDISVRHERGVAIAAVRGDIDISTVSELRETLVMLAGSGEAVIVDLSEVTFIDSTGLGALIGAYRQAVASDSSLHAVCAQPQARKLLWLTGVDRRIPVADTLEGALQSVTAARDDPQ
jgi:anti-sigma B factor antagonist